ncbi:ketopantoate reductase PanE/ApbA C terminal-domain-containing protein [Armillaria mellea]|nr:ketopantoate reductase PanE/ApbA C terminal-domain-containing protein [Armillaria mellea]
MRFHTIGLGPIGSLITHHLKSSIGLADTVTIIRRNNRQAREFGELFGNTIRVEHHGIPSVSTGYFCQIPNPTHSHSKVAQESPEDVIDSLIVTMKTYHTFPMMRMLSSRLTSASTIVLLQTGMGVYEELVQRIFHDPRERPNFILATSTHKAYTNNDLADIVHTHTGELTFGIVPNVNKNFDAGFHDESVPLFDRKGRLSDIISSPSDPYYNRLKTLRDTIQTTLRCNLALRSVVDPLTALLNCRNGQLLHSPSFRTITRRVTNEASRVFAAEIDAHLSMANSSDDNDDEERAWYASLPPKLQPLSLEEDVLKYVLDTKGHISPMLADIRGGKPTEIQNLNGHLIKTASQYRLYVPWTAQLLELVQMRSAIPLDQML